MVSRISHEKSPTSIPWTTALRMPGWTCDKEGTLETSYTFSNPAVNMSLDACNWWCDVYFTFTTLRHIMDIARSGICPYIVKGKVVMTCYRYTPIHACVVVVSWSNKCHRWDHTIQLLVNYKTKGIKSDQSNHIGFNHRIHWLSPSSHHEIHSCRHSLFDNSSLEIVFFGPPTHKPSYA